MNAYIMPEDEVRALQSKVDRILRFINNDTETGTPGLVQEVRTMRDELDKLVESIKIEREGRRVWSIVFGGIGAGLVWAGKELIHFFITK